MTETTDDTNEFYRALGRHIAAARKRAGLKQPDIANAVGLSPGSVCNIEKGVQRPYLHTLLTICATVGVTLTELITGDTTRVSKAAQDRHMLLHVTQTRATMRKLDGMLGALIESLDDPDEP